MSNHQYSTRAASARREQADQEQDEEGDNNFVDADMQFAAEETTGLASRRKRLVEELVEEGTILGLSGADLRKYVLEEKTEMLAMERERERQREEREERERERESEGVPVGRAPTSS